MLRALALLATLLLAGPAAANITIGGTPEPNTGNCAPLGCTYDGPYQQVYRAGAFAGPLTIAGVRFNNTQVNPFYVAPTFKFDITVSLSVTSTPVTGLTTDFAANRGPSPVEVFTGILGGTGWAFGDSLDIAFTTPFSYDPALGNLLLDIDVTYLAFGIPVFFDMVRDSPDTRRVWYGYSDQTPYLSDLGLVTTFLTPQNVATPEPATLALLAPAVLATLRLRRRTLTR